MIFLCMADTSTGRRVLSERLLGLAVGRKDALLVVSLRGGLFGIAVVVAPELIGKFNSNSILNSNYVDESNVVAFVDIVLQ